MAKYKVLRNLRHNGKDFSAGDEIEVGDNYVQALLDAGVISKVKKEEKEKGKKKK